MMSNHRMAGYDDPARMDVGVVGIISAVVGAISLVAGAIVTGFWQWLSGRKKGDSDAQASVMAGFVLLLGELRSERAQLVARINKCEADAQRQDRHIARLMQLMIQHNIEVPKEDEP